MASSQVEIVSSSPFGCILRDRNRRDGCRRETSARAAQAVLEKNLRELVRDQLHTKISVSSGSAPNENSENRVDSVDQIQNLCCVSNTQSNVLGGSSIRSLRQARNLDRWAANQAREMVSTIKKQSQEAEQLLMSLSKTSSPSTQNTQDNANSPGIHNLGASSLVQIWEARLQRPQPSLNRSNSINNNNSNPLAVTTNTTDNRINSGSFCSENGTLPVDSTSNEEPLLELDSIGQSAASSSAPSRSSDAGEGERVRIVDIIKRLTSDSHDHVLGNTNTNSNNCASDSSLSRRHSCSSDHQAEQRALLQVAGSTKIRGRQALNDLLLRMEMDRKRELDSLTVRQAVSRFPQRGRIQAMLRLRFLQRGTGLQDQLRPQSTRLKTSSDANRTQHGSSIMHLRERFSAGIEQSTTTRYPTESVNSSVNTSNSSPNNHMSQDGHHEGSSSAEHLNNNQIISTAEQQTAPRVETSVVHTFEVHEEVTASSVEVSRGTNLNIENFDQQQATVETTPSLNDWDENEMEEEEEEDTDDPRDYFDETHYDWFSEIARPRSYWEDRRKAWYQEMYTTSSESDEIRQLLERRTVSNFLSSDFRDRMDQLMISRVQRQVSQEDEQDEDSQESMKQLMLSFFQRHSHTEDCQEEEQEFDEGQEAEEEQALQEDDDDEEEEEEESSTNHQFVDSTDYFYPSSTPSMHSPSPFTTWSYANHHEFIDDSEQVSMIPSRLALPPQAYRQDQQHSSATSHLSIEMQLIYELRRQMEQLQLEMSELRKSTRSCVEMQVKSRCSSKQERHPVQGNGNNSLDRTPQRRSCCICYEMPVDSFLYRCGHMCTCVKCAHELQWSSGKCPICRAPILDVVRAYLDS